jgi:predicted nucleotidyltransferase
MLKESRDAEINLERGGAAPDDRPNASAVIQALVGHVRLHPQLKACWLKGSQARGDADRHSDIDLHLWLESEHADAFRDELSGWLGELYPVVRFHVLHGGAMVGAILQTGPDYLQGLHLFVETGESYSLTERAERLLWDRSGEVTVGPTQPAQPDELGRELDVAARYFWSLMLDLPGIERGEIIPAFARLSHLTGQLVIVCGLGRGIPRRVGENRGNELLSDEERRSIEGVLALPAPEPAALVRAHLLLAELMSEKGRAAAAFLGTSYPEQLEGAVLAHVRRELARQNLA